MQGKCYYCGKELTERTIKRHMKNCSEMKKIIGDKILNVNEVRDQFLISIKDKKNPGKYCIYMSIDANLQLQHLDKFIRDIWVECCNHHLSTFYIDKNEYSSNSDKQLKMNIHLKDILNVNQKFEYKYDFDLTTSLVLEIVDMIKVSANFNQIEIIARNNEENNGESDYWNSPRDGICKYKGNKNGEVPYLPQNTNKCDENANLINSKHKEIYEEEQNGNTLTYAQQHIDDFIIENSNADNESETENHGHDNNVEQISEKKMDQDKSEEINKTTNIFREMFLKGKYSFDLKELLEAYPEEQINLLAENINFILPNNLSKAETIEKYVNEYEEHMKDIMLLLNNDIYEILHKCVTNNGIINILDNKVKWNENTYSFLINKGIIFPSAESGKPIFIMPEKMKNVVNESDTFEYRKILKKNTEIINLFTGMIEVYGVLQNDHIIELIKRYNIDTEGTKILSILEQGAFYNTDYYGTLDESRKIIFINNKIENYKEILIQVDNTLEYKIFNKQELTSIIREDYLKNSNVGKKYIKEFASMFVMGKDSIVENMKMLAMEAQFRDNEEIVKDIINGVEAELDPFNEARISNMLNKFIKNIPLWKYKGATINEIESSKNAALTEQKVGRNDPCPCGSGKKFKKCCG